MVHEPILDQFLLPLAALTRGQFERLRTGSFGSARLAWDEAWTMDDTVQPLLPVPSCVVLGRRRATSKAMPDKVRAYAGTLPYRDAPEAIADKVLQKTDDAPAPTEGTFTGGSEYRSAFRNGATLYPRMLCFVERRPAGRLGANPSAPLIRSRRSSQEKQPWKDLPAIEDAVEAEFLRPLLLGESILPHRVFRPFEAVVPVDMNGKMLDAKASADRGLIGLRSWMRKAETPWKENGENGGRTLIERWNYHNELGAQFPISALRVAYSKAGTQPAACLVRDASAIIENTLYWMLIGNATEARYLNAVLNSETARSLSEKYQPRGQWGARHFDKVMFNLPIPRFDEKLALHRDLADAAARAEAVAAAVALPESVKFQRARKLVRDAFAEAGISQQIDALVAALLDVNASSRRGFSGSGHTL